jgi:hypothetical protein
MNNLSWYLHACGLVLFGCFQEKYKIGKKNEFDNFEGLLLYFSLKSLNKAHVYLHIVFACINTYCVGCQKSELLRESLIY